MSEPAPKRSRILQRADAFMASGEYYEAHMLYKGQLLRGGREQALGGVVSLLRAGQGTLAGSLAAEICERHGPSALTSVSLRDLPTSIVGCYLREVMEAAPKAPSPTQEDKDVLSGLHAELCGVYIEERDFGKAQAHCVLAGSAEAAVRLLRVWGAEGGAGECALLHLRLYFLLLLHGAHAAAAAVAAAAANTPARVVSLINKTLECGSAAQYEALLQNPAVAGFLAVDPFFAKAVEKVATLYLSGGMYAAVAAEGLKTPELVSSKQAAAAAAAATPPAPAVPAAAPSASGPHTMGDQDLD